MRTILFGNLGKFNRIQIPATLIWVAAIFVFAASSQTAADQPDWSAPLKKCWVVDNVEPSRFKIASDNELIFIPTADGAIFALFQHNGQIAWSADLGGNLVTRLSVKNGDLYGSAVFGSRESGDTNGFFRKINAKTGVPFWQYSQLEGTDLVSWADASGGITLTGRNGVIIRLDQNGRQVWKRRFDLNLSTRIMQIGDRFVGGSMNKTLIEFDAATGRILTQINLNSIPVALAADSRGKLFVGDGRGIVYGYDTNLSEAWKIKTGAGISALEIFDDDLIVTSKDNFIYRVSSSSGKKIWKRKLAGRVFGGTKVDEKYAVYLTSGSQTAVVINLTDGNLVNRLEFDAPFVGSPVRIQGGFAVPTETAVVAVSSGKCGK